VAACLLALCGVGTSVALLRLVLNSEKPPYGALVSLCAANSAILLVALLGWTLRELWLLQVLTGGASAAADAISREEPEVARAASEAPVYRSMSGSADAPQEPEVARVASAGLSPRGLLRLFEVTRERMSAADVMTTAMAVRRTSTKFLQLSPLHNAHTLADRYHLVANVVNVGTSALLASAGKEAEAVLKLRRPGRQTLLPKYKHIDVVINDLRCAAASPARSRAPRAPRAPSPARAKHPAVTRASRRRARGRLMQHILKVSKAMQLQTALISPHQQLKPKLQKLALLEAEHPLKLRLREALRDSKSNLGVEQLLSHLVKANDELYDVVGQLAIALHACIDRSADYDIFEDHELHPRETPVIPESFPVLLEARV
jgi:hypothetical protein